MNSFCIRLGTKPAISLVSLFSSRMMYLPFSPLGALLHIYSTHNVMEIINFIRRLQILIVNAKEP
jgi:hypothetical protein